MNTKQIILKESLLLFAQKGFDGVSVREIAKAVGVRESALYKHFKNKEDILVQVIAQARELIFEAYVQNRVPETTQKENIAGGYQKLSTDQLCEIAGNLFSLFTKDSMVSNFRKLLMREQFSHPEISAQYNAFFLEGAVKKQTQTFAALMAGGMFREGDAQIAALHFYGPILFLFQRYDCEPEKEEEIKELLYAHVRTFGKHYEAKERI